MKGEEDMASYQCLHLWRVAQDKMGDTPFINLHLPPLVLVRACFLRKTGDKTLPELGVVSYRVKWVETVLSQRQVKGCVW